MAKERSAKGPRELERPPGKLKDSHALILIALLVMFFFRDILLQRAFFWEDFIYQYYAFRNFAAVSLSQGTIPLWNPYTFGGMPFQADIQTALFYVPNLILTLLVAGGKLNFFWVEFTIIAHFVVAGASMYYFAKEIGLERGYALFSAVAFVFSGFMIMQVIHQTFICQVAWVPLILLMLRRAMLRRSVLWMVLAGLTLGHAVLAGSPQFTVYIFLLLFFYFLFEWRGVFLSRGLKESFPAAALAAGMVVLAVALTSVQLLPTMELAPLSKRATITLTESSEGSFHWEQLVTLAVPKYFGSSGAQGNSYLLPGPYWEYWETCIYIGLLPIVMVALSLALLRKNRYVAFFAFILAFGFLYALGNSFFLHSFFFHFVPGFDKFRVPGRMSFFFALAAAPLAGFGLRHALGRIAANPRETRKLVAIVGAGAVLLWLIAQAGLFQSAPRGAGPGAAQMSHQIALDASTAAALELLAVAGLLFLLLSRRRISVAAAVVSLVLFHFIDMNLFGFSQNNGSQNPDEYYSRNGEIVQALKERGQTEYFRVNSRAAGAMVLDRNQGMIDRIFMTEGYTPLALQRIYPPRESAEKSYDLLNAKFRISIDSVNRTMGLREVNTYLPRALIVYGDTVIRQEEAVQSYMQSPEFDPLKTVVYEEEPGFRLGKTSFDAARSAAITAYDLNMIALSASTPRDGILLLSEIYYPGWHAFVDGVEEPLSKADWSLRAVPLKAGKHEVLVRFAPESFRRGLLITLLTLAVSLGIALGSFLMGRARRRAGPGQGGPAASSPAPAGGVSPQ